MTQEVSTRFTAERHDQRISLNFAEWMAGRPSGLLAVCTGGVDVHVFLNPADIASLRAACDKVLAMFPAPAIEEAA